MPLYLYVASGSFPHRLDPRTKILALLIVFQIAMTLQHPFYLGGLLLLLLAALAAWGILARIWAGIWVLMAGLFVFTCLIWTVFLRGAAPAGGMGLLPVGTVYGAGMGLRLSLMLLGGVVFLTTTRVEEFAGALGRLGLPYRAGFALTLAFRLVPLFLENAVTVTQAQKCRGWEVDRGGPIQWARRYIPLIVPIFLTSLRSADNLSMALEAKGFGGSSRIRPDSDASRFAWRDAACLAVLAAVDAAVISLRSMGLGKVLL